MLYAYNLHTVGASPVGLLVAGTRTFDEVTSVI